MKIYKPITILCGGLMSIAPHLSAQEFIACGVNNPASCNVESIQHKFTPVKHEYYIEGRCARSSPDDEAKCEDWINAISYEARVSWDEEHHEVEESVRFADGKKGALTASCPTDPVIFNDVCGDVVMQGSIYVSTHKHGDYFLAPVLLSRAVLSPNTKVTLRSELSEGFALPKIHSPIDSYRYGEQNRISPGVFSIPVFVNVTYSANIDLSLKKWMPKEDGDEGQWVPKMDFSITASDLQHGEYAGKDLFAGRHEFELEHGKYMLTAVASVSEWTSTSNPVSFWVIDPDVMKKNLMENKKRSVVKPKTEKRDVRRAVVPLQGE